MDFSVYVMLILFGMILVLAMWVCANSNINKWGPDTTLDLPVHLIQESLFKHQKLHEEPETPKEIVPSAPSELQYDPLLCGRPLSTKPPIPPKPPRLSLTNMENPILPPLNHQSNHSTFTTFTMSNKA